ncbi:phospholipase D4 isoform X2 [Phoca vitulina]|uniref:phospholipase D4 isoform X2 n=1 Tax=Phoca vitulina TaxID=9720 RepID=UPI001395EC3C|nr:phospholipase D4 isoform X2 [Phoca vitulina]
MHTKAGPPELQMLGTLAMLWLGAVTLAYVLWQVHLPPTCGQLHPGEGPTGSRGHGSSLAWESQRGEAGQQPQDSCRLVLVESIPQDLPSAAGRPSAQPLAQAWLQLLDTAQESIHMASFYWSLTGPDIGVNDSSSQLGEALLQKLEQLLDKNISLVVATSSRSLAKNSTDLQVLAARGAQVRFVPMRKLTGGVLHSKFWVVDGRHIYLGSANMDWRALTQASPPMLCPHGRTRDLEALLAVMGGAREFIYASVMEYFPTTRFSHPARYWPVLDTALRTAAFDRGVRVRLLVSCWPHTDPSMFPDLRSLQAFSNPAAGVSVDVKVFIVPVGNHSNIPFSRVNHSKFMVTEKAAYIGTSNWSEDYFSSTSGVGLVVSQRAPSARPGTLTVQEQLRRLFERDWDSRYAVRLDGRAQGRDCAWQG